MKKSLILLLTGILTFSSCSKKEPIIIDSKEFLNKSSNIGTVDGAECYKYEIEGKVIYLLNKGVDNNTTYNISKVDSLEIKKMPINIKGSPTYAIKRAFKK